MTNAEYYGFNSNGYFTKHIDHIPKKVEDMNVLEFLKWLSSEKAPELTASEKTVSYRHCKCLCRTSGHSDC